MSKPAPRPPCVLRCDKTQVQRQGGRQLHREDRVDSSGDPHWTSPPCPSKGVLGDGHFCTDYVSSHRDNAGDLLLEVLFDKDMRGTI